MHPVEDAALFEFWQLASNNRLKAFASLPMFLSEYGLATFNRPCWFVLKRCFRAAMSCA